MPRRENILVVVNPSRGIHPALDRAIINAHIREESEQSTLFVLVTTDQDILSSTDQQDSMRNSTWINNMKQRVLGAGLECHILLCWSSNWAKSVLDSAEEHNCGMIMVPFYGKVSDQVLSDSKWQLIRNAKVPTLLVRPGSDSSRNKILAAIKTQDSDYIELNKRVLERSKWGAERYNAKLHVINAYTRPDEQPDRQKMIELTGLPTEQIHIEQGDPSKVIPAIAAEINADTLVIGNRLRPGSTPGIRGNTIEHIIDDIPQDIMMML